MRENACIKGSGAQRSASFDACCSDPPWPGWFSGHFHLSHDYEDSITFPGEALVGTSGAPLGTCTAGGNRRGHCVFAQTGVMRSHSSRDGRPGEAKCPAAWLQRSSESVPGSSRDWSRAMPRRLRGLLGVPQALVLNHQLLGIALRALPGFGPSRPMQACTKHHHQLARLRGTWHREPL